MPRFVILEHDHPHLHWDLMLEASGALRTWRLATPPGVGQCVPAISIGDHRLAYLDYEGPVSGGRGRVRRWDAGTFEWVEQRDRFVIVRLAGAKLDGTLLLERQQGEAWVARLDWQDS